MKGKKVVWQLSDVIIAVVFLIILMNFTYFTKNFFNLTGKSFGISERLFSVIEMAFVYFLLFLVVWGLTVRKYKVGWEELGFSSFDFSGSLVAGIFWVLIIKTLSGIYGLLASRFLNFNPPPDLVERIFALFGKDWLGLLLASLVAGLIAPLVEEIFFRGFIYSALRKRMKVFWAVIISAIIFSIFHLNLWSFIPVFLIGVVLAFLYEKSGSLGPPVILHSLNNLLSVFLIYFFTNAGGKL